MMTMMTTLKAEVTVKCLRCGHQWMKRTPDRPKACPNCKQTRWDVPSQWARLGKKKAK
jgi:Zn finger protein HypA/HybF involved in hydrogenase expression